MSALGPYWHAHGHGREAEAWFDRALTEAPTAPDELRARVVWASAYQAIYTSDTQFGIGRAQAALELAERATSVRSLGAPDSLATHRQWSDPAGAQPILLEAAALAEAQGDIWCQIDCLQKAAYSDYYRDRWPEAIEGSIEVERLASSIGNRLFLSYNDLLYGTAAWRQGNWEEAKRRLRKALDAGLELGEPMTIASPATLLFWIELRSGNPEAAGGVRAEVQDVLGEKLAETMVGSLLSCVEAVTILELGDPEPADSSVNAVCDALLADGVLFPTSLFLPLLAVAQMAAGDLREAQRTIDRLRASPTTYRVPPRPATPTTWQRSWLGGKAVRISRRPLRVALSPCTSSSGLRPLAVEALEIVGGCLVDLGKCRRAPSARRSRGDRE